MRKLVFLFILTSALGCSQGDHSIVGSWSWQNPMLDTEVGYKFNADGTYEFWFHGKNARIDEKGTYLLKDDQVSFSPEQTTTDDGSKAGPHAATIVWTGANSFQLKDDKGTTVWKRAEE